MRLAELKHEPFVSMGPGFGLRSLTDAIFRDAGFRPRVAFESQDSHTIRGLVSAGLGYSILPPGGLGPGPQGADIALEPDSNLLKLDEALNELAKIDPRQSRIVELRYFGGLTIEETAEVISVSPATVKREWMMARAWLHQEISESELDQTLASDSQ